MRERTTHAAGDKTIRRYVHGPVTDEIIRQDYFSSGGSIKSVYHHHDLLGSNLCRSDTTIHPQLTEEKVSEDALKKVYTQS